MNVRDIAPSSAHASDRDANPRLMAMPETKELTLEGRPSAIEHAKAHQDAVPDTGIIVLPSKFEQMVDEVLKKHKV